jgi:hypothetical protein
MPSGERIHFKPLTSLVEWCSHSSMHPERIHRMSMKCTFQLDRQRHPHNVKVVSNTHNRWAEETARRAIAAAKFPPLPKSVIQQSGADLASIDYQLDLGEPR